MAARLASAVLPHLDRVEDGCDGLGEVLARALEDGGAGAPLTLPLEDGARLTAHLRTTKLLPAFLLKNYAKSFHIIKKAQSCLFTNFAPCLEKMDKSK